MCKYEECDNDVLQVSESHQRFKKLQLCVKVTSFPIILAYMKYMIISKISKIHTN